MLKMTIIIKQCRLMKGNLNLVPGNPGKNFQRLAEEWELEKCSVCIAIYF